MCACLQFDHIHCDAKVLAMVVPLAVRESLTKVPVCVRVARYGPICSYPKISSQRANYGHR